MSSSESLRRAAALLVTGDWQGAHGIVQDDPSSLAAWMHGIVHLLEGDESNARYWYERAGRAFPRADAVHDEIEAARVAADELGPWRGGVGLASSRT
jgi:hypothetical protein